MVAKGFALYVSSISNAPFFKDIGIILCGCDLTASRPLLISDIEIPEMFPTALAAGAKGTKCLPSSGSSIAASSPSTFRLNFVFRSPVN